MTTVTLTTYNCPTGYSSISGLVEADDINLRRHVPESLIDTRQDLRAGREFCDKLLWARDKRSLENAVQGLRVVGSSMRSGKEDDAGDGVDDVLEHGVTLTL